MAIQLLRRFTLDNCEAALSAIAMAPDQDLWVPSNAETAHMGGDAAMVQIVSTWANVGSGASVGTYAVTPEQRQQWARSLHGICAMLLKRPLKTIPDGVDVTDELRDVGLARLDELQGPIVVRRRGMSADVVCADHFGRSRPALFYAQGGDGSRLMDPSVFRASTESLIEMAVPQTYRRWLSLSDRDAISGILYETFENTHDHARTDWRGDSIPVSLRGVSIRHHSVELATMNELAEAFPALARFCARQKPPTRDLQKLQLLEISVFDSGPGLASHLLKRPLAQMSLEEELAAVVDCFKKNVTSKGRRGFGQGLPFVVEMLAKHGGLYRLRTGRLSLCADPAGNGGRFVLEDVSGSASPRERAPVSGAAATYILPVRKP